MRTREDSQFRHTARGREVVAPAGESANHVHVPTSSRVGIGSITSRKANTLTFFERLALELSGAGDPSQAIVPFCTPAQAKQLYDEGKLQ